MKAKNGNTELATLISGAVGKETSVTGYWSKYIKVDDKWYVSDESTYGATLDESNPTKTVNYSATNISQFFETDDMTVSKTCATVDGNSDYSNGNGVSLSGSANMATNTAIPAGTYSISIYSIYRTSGKTSSFDIYTSADNKTWSETAVVSISVKAGNTLSTATVTLSADSYIKFQNSSTSNQNHYVDYVTFTPLYEYSVKAMNGDTELATLASGNAEKGTEVTKYWSKYIKVDDKWYVSDETTYGATLDESNPTKTVNYSATNISQFFETDDMTVSKTYGTVTNNTAYSNGNGLGIYGGGSGNTQATMTTKTTVPAGTYDLSIQAVVRNANKTDGFNIFTSTDGETRSETAVGSITINAGTGLSTTQITLSADSYIKFQNSATSNQNHYVDYVTFTPLYKFTLAATDGTNYWATFSDADNVTFWPTANATVKKATVSGSTLTLPELTKETVTIGGNEVEGYFVPANTGVLIKATGTSVNYYKVTGKTVDDLTDNNLYPGTGAVISSPTNCHYYMLAYAKPESGQSINHSTLGFYYGAADGTAFTSRKGAAYLAIPTSSGAKISGFVFDGDTATGITDVNTDTNSNAGVRKVWRNGQLVILRNNKIFSATGAEIK